MSAFIMLIGVIVVLSCITFLSRRNINRFFRHRKMMAVLMLVRGFPDK